MVLTSGAGMRQRACLVLFRHECRHPPHRPVLPCRDRWRASERPALAAGLDLQADDPSAGYLCDHVHFSSAVALAQVRESLAGAQHSRVGLELGCQQRWASGAACFPA